jgi:superfamily II DNA or RNA helicase
MDLTAISSRPGLVELIKSDAWTVFFDQNVLKRATSYTKPARLLKLDVIDRGSSVTVICRFRGNYATSYQAVIGFEQTARGSWTFLSHCSCPIGDDCKHVAAAFLTLTDRLNQPTASLPNSIESDDSEISAWLTSVSVSLTSPAPPAQKTKPSDSFLAYCLKSPVQSYESRFTLSLHVGRTLKSGEIRINLNSNANADPIRPPKYMRPEDTMPCTLFNQLLRSGYHYDGLRMEGQQAGLLLEQSLGTGRLFLIINHDEPQRLVPGDLVFPEPTWESQSDGSARPAFAPPFSDAVGIINTQPPHILLPHSDVDKVSLNPLDLSKYSANFLKAWSSGPTLKPEQVATAATALQRSLPALPKPIPTETKTLKKSKPQIHLHLHRANPFTHGGLHFSGQPAPIIGELSFQYHGHSFTPNLAEAPEGKASFIASKNGKVYTIPRDTKVEHEIILHLVNEHSFIPAVVHDSAISPDHRSAFLPRGEASRWDMAAAEFITRSVAILREENWQITIDTTAKIEVHTIGPDELDTGLEEHPDHGIDWFQFSASYLTPAGDKQALLPLLSSYLRMLDFDTIDETLDSITDDDKTLLKDPESPNCFLALPTKRLLLLAKTLHDLFGASSPDAPLHRLQAAALADVLEMDSSQTLKDLATLGKNLKNVTTLPRPKPPKFLNADLRDYQLDGFHWMQFLARHGLHGILADDMGLGKTVQALTHLQAEVSGRRTRKLPSLVLAPTSVVGNWKAEAKKFTPKLKTLLLHGPERHAEFKKIPAVHLVITSYALLVRDFSEFEKQDFHLVILDEAQYIKNPAAKVSQHACKLRANHRLSLSGTPLENHLGELWSQFRFLMPGILGSSESFRKTFRTPIEKHGDSTAQLTLNSRVAPLILRRTKDQVATELPPKTEILHRISLNPGQIDIYETVRAAMDDRIRDAIADKGLAKSQIIVLDALLKLRQICCHPQLLKLPAAQKVKHSAKLDFLTDDLLPTLLGEGRKILIFSTFTTMLALIQKHLEKKKIPFSKITGSTKNRQKEIDEFQAGATSVFLISLKAGGTGLNLTAADTVIHYDPWWNPAAENQATDRAHRIGQDKPVFVHKLITEGSIEERIVQLQAQKAKLVEALLSEKTTKLQLDQKTLGNLLAPLE